MTGPNTSTSAWADFRHLDRGEAWTRSERLAQELSAAQGAPMIHLARELVALQGELTNDERLAAELLFMASMVEVESGSTCMNTDPAALSHLFVRLASLTGKGLPNLDLTRLAQMASSLVLGNQLPSLIGQSAEQGLPFVLREGWLHEGRLLAREQRLAAAVVSRLGTAESSCATPSNIPEYLTDEQAHAVNAAVSRALTIVSGGPGTGKTSIIVAIISAALARGIKSSEICLAAPTGKAAWRMTDAVRQTLAELDSSDTLSSGLADGQTLHRLLGYSPSSGRYLHHQANPLHARLVIIDEASMIDTVLMERTFAATHPEAHLVLLGDSEQLPSVRAGAVFRSLTTACTGVTTKLTQNFRMRADDPDGSQILKLAQHIRSGQPLSPDSMNLAEGVDDVLWRGVERLEKPTVKTLARAWYTQFVAPLYRDELPTMSTDLELEAVFKVMESSRVLCATRHGTGGVHDWNLSLHSIHAQTTQMSAREPFIPGDPVMMTKNDYQRNLFNGDQGIVVKRRDHETERLYAVFRDTNGFRSFLLDGLRDHLELCYAMTVHKSQGSEFNTVGIVLPDQDVSSLSRELLYTAVTRSRRCVLFMGASRQLNLAIARPVQRASALTELIEAELMIEDNIKGEDR